MDMDFENKRNCEIAKESKKLNKIFMQDTKSDDILVVILKAHLYIERELIKMLTETILDEKILKSTTFKQKLDLANTLGIVDEYYGTIGKVNSIRNNFAHKVDYKFEESVLEEILSTLTKKDKEDFFEDYECWKPVLYDGTIPELNFKLQLLLNNIWFALISCRTNAKKAIELKLREKELEVVSKYYETDNVK